MSSLLQLRRVARFRVRLGVCFVLCGGCASPTSPDTEPPLEPPATDGGALDATATRLDAGTHARPVDGARPASSSLDAAADAGVLTDADAGVLTDADAGVLTDSELCPDGFPRGKASGVARLLHAMTPGPEGVGVCPNGDVFAGAGEVLWRMMLDGGAPEAYATLPGRSLESIACDAHNRIFVADISATSAALLGLPPALAPAIMLLQPGARTATALVGPDAGVPLTGFNGLLELPGLGLYTTDMLAGLVVRYREVAPDRFEAEVVKDGLLGANGLAYDPDRAVLYLAQTGVIPNPDRVLEMPLNANGSLGPVKEIWMRNQQDGVDGLAIDEHGAVYRANQLAGTVVRMPEDLTVARVPNPASLAFRGGTMLITDFKLFGPLQNGGTGGVYTVDLGVCGGRTH